MGVAQAAGFAQARDAPFPAGHGSRDKDLLGGGEDADDARGDEEDGVVKGEKDKEGCKDHEGPGLGRKGVVAGHPLELDEGKPPGGELEGEEGDDPEGARLQGRGEEKDRADEAAAEEGDVGVAVEDGTTQGRGLEGTSNGAIQDVRHPGHDEERHEEPRRRAVHGVGDEKGRDEKPRSRERVRDVPDDGHLSRLRNQVATCRGCDVSGLRRGGAATCRGRQMSRCDVSGPRHANLRRIRVARYRVATCRGRSVPGWRAASHRRLPRPRYRWR